MTDLSAVETLATKTVRRRVPGKHLRAARDAVGISQEMLAKRLDVRIPTISERENADDVAWETWLAWAMALELPADWKPATPPRKRKQVD